MRGVLSPPNATPSRPVGGEVVYVSAPNPVWVEGFPGIPARTLLESPKFGWLKTLKNWVLKRNFTRSVKGNHSSDKNRSRQNLDREERSGRDFRIDNSEHCHLLNMHRCLGPHWKQTHLD